MHGTFKRGSELEQRKMSQRVIDDYNNLKQKIKRLEEKLTESKDMLAMFQGMFPELKGPTVREAVKEPVDEEQFAEDVALPIEDEWPSGRGER